MTVDVRFNGRAVPVSNGMFYGFRDFAAATGLREGYLNIAGEFNLNSSGRLVEYPVNVVVGRNSYNTPAQYHELMAHLLLNNELRVPARVRFMSTVLASVETAYLPLYQDRILIRNVNLGLTDAFCARNGLTEAAMAEFRGIGMESFAGFFARVPRITTGIPRTEFTVLSENTGSFYDASDNTVTIVEMPAHQEQVFHHPVFDWIVNGERMRFLHEHGMLDFHRLSPAEMNAEFERDGSQIRLPFGR